jgi:amino-acid N-acetyltransferase
VRIDQGTPSARPRPRTARSRRRPIAPRRAPEPILRAATPADARAVHALIAEHLSEGHLLPRTLEDIEATISRFIVAVSGRRVVGCADLAPLGPLVAEVRSLVVSNQARSRGLGQHLVNELARRARAAGFDSLCAFTHAAGYFVRMGFSIVPHPWVPEKIETDCRTCPQFRRCGQFAVVLDLAPAQATYIPLMQVHG